MTKSDIFILSGIAGGIGGLIFGLYERRKATELYRRFDMAITDLEKNETVDISEKIYETAMRTVAERKVEKGMLDIEADILSDIKSDMRSRVENTISDLYPDLKDKISGTADDIIKNIDTNKLMREIRDDAKKIITKKFADELNDITDDYKENLTNIKKIYQSAADAMSNKTQESRTVSFSL